ncbi:MAG: hypothetical protein KAT66_11005 [Candidatus Lokiarchaeota archaeon]|nr:hypothetical protein [Candidatus Lokiarchaeota archaeon]
MSVNENYNRILEDTIKEELIWLEQEFNYLFRNKKEGFTENDIKMGNQILNNVIDNININHNENLLHFLTLTLDKIEQTYPQFF